MQLCYSPKELVTMFKERTTEFKALGVLPNNGIWSKFDEKRHFKAFAQYAEMVGSHNKKPGVEWVSVINQFAPMTPAERRGWLGLNTSKVIDVPRREITHFKRSIAEVPHEKRKGSVDYTHKLPPIKNQGSCGSCWIFGAVAPLEYQINKEESEITSLSEQQYLDCVYSRDGCQGGWHPDVYDWTIDNDNLIAKVDEYPDPYLGVDGECRTNVPSGLGDYRLTGYSYIGGGDELMEAAVADPRFGVLGVYVGVFDSFFSYGSGVYYDTDCSVTNHAVDVVGYDTLDGIPYWKVRNSWGSSWGVNGHIKMKRGHGLSTCGVADHAIVPIVSKNGDDDFNDYTENETGYECRDRNDGTGVFYRGTVSQTISGHVCQMWTSDTPNSGTVTPEEYVNKGLGDHNYCRNPDGGTGPWCYNSEGTSPRWEYCDIPECRECAWETTSGTTGFEKNVAMDKCEQDASCEAVVCDGDFFCWLSNDTNAPPSLQYGVYVKEADCTIDGFENEEEDVLIKRDDGESEDNTNGETCKWEVKSKGLESYTKETAETKCEMSGECKGISCESSNYCWLNMKSSCDFEKTYTVYIRTCGTTPDDEFDNDDEETGKECREPDDSSGYYYRGTINQTPSGRTCQNWTSQEPNSHTLTPEDNVGEGLGDHNYCRNPDGGTGPWCYNGEGTSPRWEYCDVPVCPTCKWKRAAEGSTTQNVGDAKKDCKISEECKAVVCKGDETCWLNDHTTGASDIIPTEYAKLTNCHEL